MRRIHEYIIVYVCLLAMVYDLPLAVSTIVLPSVLAYAIPLLYKINKKIIIESIIVSVSWIVVSLLTTFLSVAHFDLTILIRYLLQLISSIVLYAYTRSIFMNTNEEIVYKSTTVVLYLLLVLGVLEAFTPFQEVVIEVSRAIYSLDSGYRFYLDDSTILRDIGLAGRRRVTGFTAEASLYSIAISFLVLIRYLTDKKKRVVSNVIALLGAFVLSRSPFSLAGIILLLLHTNLKISPVRSISASIVLLVAIFYNADYITQRLSYFSLNYTYLTSEALRFLIPMQVLAQVVKDFPLHGIGPLGMYDVNLVLSMTNGYSDRIGDNALILIGVSFGILLFPFLYYVTYARHSVRMKSLRSQIAFHVTIGFCLTSIGSFVSPKSWIMIGLYLGCISLLKR